MERILPHVHGFEVLDPQTHALDGLPNVLRPYPFQALLLVIHACYVMHRYLPFMRFRAVSYVVRIRINLIQQGIVRSKAQNGACLPGCISRPQKVRKSHMVCRKIDVVDAAYLFPPLHFLELRGIDQFRLPRYVDVRRPPVGVHPYYLLRDCHEKIVGYNPFIRILCWRSSILRASFKLSKEPAELTILLPFEERLRGYPAVPRAVRQLAVRPHPLLKPADGGRVARVARAYVPVLLPELLYLAVPLDLRYYGGRPHRSEEHTS